MGSTEDWPLRSWNIRYEHQCSTMIRVTAEGTRLSLQVQHAFKPQDHKLVGKQLCKHLDTDLIDGPFDFCNSATGQAQLHLNHLRDLLLLKRPELSGLLFHLCQESLQDFQAFLGIPAQ